MTAQRSTLAATSLTHIVQDGLVAAIYVMLPVLAQAYGLSYLQVGVLKGLNSGAQALLEFASGRLSEWTGEAKLLALGMAGAGIGYGLLAFAPGIVAIAGCFLLIGLGGALHHAPSSSLIANTYDDKGRAAALGLYNASGDVGKLVFSGIFSGGIAAGLLWWQISALFGAITLAAAFSVAVMASGMVGRNDAVASHGQSEPGGGWGIVDRKSFSMLIVATALDTAVQTGLMVFIAFLMLAKGVPLAWATMATVLVLLGGVFGKVACGRLSQTLGAVRAFALAQALTVIGLIALIVLPAVWAFVLLLPLGAMAQGSSSITYGLAATMIHPARMARGYALLYSIGTAAAMAGPLAFGWVADVWSVSHTIAVMAVLTGLSVMPVLLLRRGA